MRKLHRVHEHGITNASVLERAGLDHRKQLHIRSQQQLRCLQQDTERATFLIETELQQATVLHSEIEQLALLDTSTCLTPINRRHITPMTCPVCGVTFDGAPSLHKHIQAKHPDLNKAARIHFNRAEHSLFGLPFCRFCRVRCGDWHALEKHTTQGMCMRLKQGFAANLSLAEILDQVRAEEKATPPTPPAEHIIQTQATELCQHVVFQTPLHEVPKHFAYIRSFADVCALCGQRLQQASRVKSHWQRQHARAWDLAQQDAASTAKSMLAVFNTPCQFCGSTAKNTKQHVDKCSAFFQVAAIRHLLHQGHLVATLTAQKAPALKPHETQPAYKSFALRNTPLGKAFHGKLVVGSGVQTPGDAKEMNPVSTLTTAHGHVGGQVPAFIVDTIVLCFESVAHGPIRTTVWLLGLKSDLVLSDTTLVAHCTVMTGAEMETETEEMHFFTKYWPTAAGAPPNAALQADPEEEPPQKWPKLQDKGDGKNKDTRSKGRNQWGGKRQHPPKHQQPSSWGWQGNDRANGEVSYELMMQVQRLLLRHEDCLSLIRAEYGFVMFFRIDVPCSVIRPLFEAQKLWRQTKETSPEQLTKPMRTTLMACLIKELTQRITQFQEPGQVGTDRDGLPHAKVLATLAAMDALISIPDTLQRFHPTRPLTAEMSGTVLPFCLMTGMRTKEADTLNSYMRELSNNACTQLLAMNMRPERPQRSALAQLIARQL
ncbi:unnamed protein product [Symbiodinium necroappetens]|uniref:C2H2-type domain-containing protein n=1 Tax=Symbiodinium necroappetens TaxID=1628268 RepID=A0A812WIG2_9DINO|nr:unnamed protein product [Symbiodinium necroappetens]